MYLRGSLWNSHIIIIIIILWYSFSVIWHLSTGTTFCFVQAKQSCNSLLRLLMPFWTHEQPLINYKAMRNLYYWSQGQQNAIEGLQTAQRKCLLNSSESLRVCAFLGKLALPFHVALLIRSPVGREIFHGVFTLALQYIYFGMGILWFYEHFNSLVVVECRPLLAINSHG